MKLSFKLKFSFVMLMFGLMFSLQAKAATLEVALEKAITSTKDDVSVIVTINSEDQDVNTAQATISFPTNLLSVTKIDRSDSVFSFWLQEPTYDNDKGTISFVGGSTSGFNGPGLKIMHIGFKVKGSGTGRLGISDGSITASDGTGTNVYNTAKGLDINIPSTAEFQAVQLQQSARQAIVAKKLPSIPSVSIPFYPDPTKWNNRSAGFQAKWNLDPDTKEVGVAVNNLANFDPKADLSALSGMKVFSALADGVHYLHLRYSNNIGWGPTLHYRLAIDTNPPSPFKITSDSNFKTIDPTPTINFSSSDLASGINNYIIRLDGSVVGNTNLTKYDFSPLLPGVHQLVVLAVDNAGNSTSQTVPLEILPIDSPVITYVSDRVIANEGGITAGGTSLNSSEIIVQVTNTQKQVVAEQIVPVDSKGNWNILINKALNTGDYYLSVTSRDKNMASSLPVISSVIKVKIKPLLVLGNLEISQLWFFVGLIVLLLGGFWLGWFTYHNWRGQLERRVVIAQRDVVNTLENLSKNVEKMLKNYSNGDLNKSDIAEMEHTLKEMKDILERSRHYVVDNIREINN